MIDFEYQDGLKDLQNLLACTKNNQTKIPRNFNIWHLELGNYFWKQKFRTICNKKSWFSFRFCSTKFLFVIVFDLIWWNRCGLMGKSQNIHNCPSIPSSPRWSTQPLHHTKKQMTRFQSMLLINFLPIVLLLRFYNSKSCCNKLRWNWRKESWWSWYHLFPSPGSGVMLGK